MFKKKLGFIPKKMVEFDGTTLKIGNNPILLDGVQCAYFRPFNLAENEWGTVYFSPDGEDWDINDFFNKSVIKFTKNQTESVFELLSIMGIRVIEKGNELNSTTVKPTIATITCPNCNNTDLTFIGNNRKNFSVGKAIAGTVLTGGVGALAGFTGKKGDNQWHCKKCGNSFETK